MTPPHRFHPSIAIQGVIAAAILWTILFGIAFVHEGTRWPHATPAVPVLHRAAVSRYEAWENFILVVVIVTFLFLKAWAMARRSRRVDGLGASLIAANVAFAIVYAWTIASQLYGWHTTPWITRLVLRWPLILVLAWGAWELSRIGDGPGDRAVLKYDPRRGDRRGPEPGRRRGDRDTCTES